MDPLSYPIFKFISGLVISEFNGIMEQATTKLANNVLILAGGVETIYLMYFGFLLAFGKATDGIKTPNIRFLLYHMCTFMFMIGMLSQIDMVSEFIFSFRKMLISGLLKSNDLAGEISTGHLDKMYMMFAGLETAQAFITPTDLSSGLKQTSLMLSLGADVAPQIMGCIVLLLNDMLARIGMSLTPLMVYLAFYKSTRPSFNRWLQRMFGLAMQAAALALILHAAEKVTEAYVGMFAALLGLEFAASKIPGMAFFISEFQQSVMQAGFGFTLTCLMVWFPANAGSFCIGLYAVTTRVNLGDRAGVKAKIG